MIRRSTVVYIVILAALGGLLYYFNNREQPAADILITPEVVEEPQYLFSAADGVPNSIRIVSKAGDTVEVTRDADNAWKVILPIDAAAEQGASEAAASQVTTMRILESIPDIDLDLVGITNPDYIINIRFDSDLERTLKVGVVTPTESGYYVQDASGGDVMIVSKSSLDALLGLLTAPPYLETPTPSPVVTETPLPSPTPEATTPAAETATPQS